MSLEITCKLLFPLAEQTGTGKNGPWVKQDIIVETEEQYPKKVCLSAWGDLVGQFKTFAPNTRLKVNFRVESREYNGRWYTDVRPWKVEAIDAGANVNAVPSNAGYATPMETATALAGNNANDNDDLPF